MLDQPRKPRKGDIITWSDGSNYRVTTDPVNDRIGLYWLKGEKDCGIDYPLKNAQKFVAPTFKVGDRVRLFDGGRKYNRSPGFDCVWISDMDDIIGKMGTVKSQDAKGVRIIFDDVADGQAAACRYPALALELFEAPALEFKVGGYIRALRDSVGWVETGEVYKVTNLNKPDGWVSFTDLDGGRPNGWVMANFVPCEAPNNFLKEVAAEAPAPAIAGPVQVGDVVLVRVTVTEVDDDIFKASVDGGSQWYGKAEQILERAPKLEPAVGREITWKEKRAWYKIEWMEGDQLLLTSKDFPTRIKKLEELTNYEVREA